MNTERGLRITLDGVQFLPECTPKITFYQANRHQSWNWPSSSWWHGREKVYSTKQLTFDPDRAVLSLSFPDTNYVHTVAFDLNR